MNKKYELTNETIQFQGKTLYRIKALRSFAGIQKGDLGGYVENEHNLSHNGNCWIHHNAKAMDSSEVIGNAKLLDEAVVGDRITIAGYAWVSGYAVLDRGNCVLGGNSTYGSSYTIPINY